MQIRVEDWLVIYELEGELKGHQSVRNTEMWTEWGLVGVGHYTDSDLALATQRVIEKAHALGPPEHGTDGTSGSHGWCSYCEGPDCQHNFR
jgi:hypothetical protein